MFSYDEAVASVLAMTGDQLVRTASRLDTMTVVAARYHSERTMRTVRMVFHAMAAAIVEVNAGVIAAGVDRPGALVEGVCTAGVWDVADAMVIPFACLCRCEAERLPPGERCAAMVRAAEHHSLRQAHAEVNLPIDWRWSWVAWRYAQLRRDPGLVGGHGLSDEDVPPRAQPTMVCSVIGKILSPL